MIWKHAARMGGALAVFAIITTALLAFTYLQTKSRVEANEQQLLQDRLQAVMPASGYDNKILKDSITVRNPALLGSTEPVTVYRARKDGKPVGVAFQAIAPNGYSGNITLLVGIYADGRVAGVRVLSHKETPGLGDAIEIERSPWILSFNGKSLKNPPPELWAVRKDGGIFDQFTGATITPRAVVGAVKKALEFFEANRRILFSAPSGSAPATSPS